jgi:DNA-binding PadR family transcriptional regulator
LTDQGERTFHAVEKDGVITAIWEMEGRKHIRTIDPRSAEGRRILNAYTADEDSHESPASEEATPQQSE